MKCSQKNKKKSKISHIHYVLMEAEDIFGDMHFLLNAENKGKKMQMYINTDKTRTIIWNLQLQNLH